MSSDDWLDDLLRESAEQPLSDDGFSAAVMQRVHAVLPPLPAAQALVRVHERCRQERRQKRWSVGGAAVGVGIALAIVQGAGSSTIAGVGLWAHWAVPMAAVAIGSLVLALLALGDAQS